MKLRALSFFALSLLACSSTTEPTVEVQDVAVEPTDTSTSDTGASDTSPDDTSTGDTSTGDTSPSDTGASDTTASDTRVADVTTVDTSAPVDARTDSRAPDASPETATGDAGVALARVRMFLSGHSLTDNPLADHMLSISASLSTDLLYNQQIGIGSPIRVRTKGNDPGLSTWPGYSSGKNRTGSNMNVIEELKNPQTLGAGDKYDTLVITERHDLLGCVEWENTVGYTRHFHDRLIDGNAAGNTYLYQSWLDVDKADPAEWIAYEKKALYAWECVATKVNQTLTLNSRAGRVTPLPAGAALVALVERLVANTMPGITGTLTARMSTIFSDNVHMTPLGSYYVALVTYASVFRRSPVSAAGPAGANAQTVAAMQQLAWDFVQAYYAAPSPGTHTMAECRAYVSAEVCPGMWNLLNDPSKITGCQNKFSSATDSPFRDETSYTPLPAP